MESTTTDASQARERDAAADNGAAPAVVRPGLARRAFAEGFATFALVVAGCQLVRGEHQGTMPPNR